MVLYLYKCCRHCEKLKTCEPNENILFHSCENFRWQLEGFVPKDGREFYRDEDGNDIV